jgi:hypothetical protein
VICYQLRPQPEGHGPVAIATNHTRAGSRADAGIDQLAGAFQVAPGTVDQIADTVCEVMLRDSSREDDTCLLVCQLTSERAAGGAEPPAAAHPGRLS